MYVNVCMEKKIQFTARALLCGRTKLLMFICWSITAKLKGDDENRFASTRLRPEPKHCYVYERNDCVCLRSNAGWSETAGYAVDIASFRLHVVFVDGMLLLFACIALYISFCRGETWRRSRADTCVCVFLLFCSRARSCSSCCR